MTNTPPNDDTIASGSNNKEEGISRFKSEEELTLDEDTDKESSLENVNRRFFNNIMVQQW